MALRRRNKTEIQRLAHVAREALERERAHRARLSERGQRLVSSGRTLGLVSVGGLVLLALVRKRSDRGDREADDRPRRDVVKRARRRKDSRILELARLAVTTGRFWESAAARR